MSEKEADPSECSPGEAAMKVDTDSANPESQLCELTLGDLPEEILEHILGFLSHYRDMDVAKLVSKQWNRVIKSTVKQKKRKFHQSLANCDVQWEEICKEKPAHLSERAPIGISDRFSHSAAYLNGLMYVFGGCTSTSTTFNDLWTFDLTNRRWVRPVAMGTYPSPKACATMVVYNGNLVLFGGWSHPIPYPLHQSAHYFSELHVYSPATNRWSHVHSLGQEPEALGGHSASVAGHLMVVFGGSPRPGLGTNKLWVFNFQKASWTLQPVCGDHVPEPRYGQFQTSLDDSHILIMGGCVGQNRVYTDVWLLTLDANGPWHWSKLSVECPEFGAPQSWCHAACRVKDVIVVVAKSNSPRQTIKPRRRVIPRHHRRPSGPDQTEFTTAGTSEKHVVGSATVTSATCRMPGPGVYVHPTMHAREREPQNPCHSISEVARQGASLPCVSQSSPPVRPSSSTPESTSPLNSSTALTQGSPRQSSGTASSLLALQQRLHRECLNLQDPDNHHSRGRSSSTPAASTSFHAVGSSNENPREEEVPEGYFHRLENRYSGELSEEERCSSILEEQQHRLSQAISATAQARDGSHGSTGLELAQDAASSDSSSGNKAQLEPTQGSASPDDSSKARLNPTQGATASPTSRDKSSQAAASVGPVPPRAMPSIRPNAMYNRQRQLQALERQEALLRSRSRAAQGQGQGQNAQGALRGEVKENDRGKDNPSVQMKSLNPGPVDNKDVEDDDEGRTSPELVATKNKMDIHVLDISAALTTGIVSWGKPSEFQPHGAPEETICCSLVPGRAELALFGGVRRTEAGNIAVSRLFLLHPG